MRADAAIYIHDPQQMQWEPTGRAGVWQKSIRTEPERGQFLGLVRMEPMTRTGLHRHLGFGGAYVVAGGVHDYFSDQLAGEYAINHKSTVHEAFSYTDTLLATRLEAPQVFLEEEEVLQFRNGGRHATPDELRTPDPEVAPDLLFNLRTLPVTNTKVAGVRRTLIFDYARSEIDHRICLLRMLPSTAIPAFKTSALTEFMMLGGEVKVNGLQVSVGNYCILEPGAEVSIQSDFGASMLVWSEGRIGWADGRNLPDLFGF